MTRDRAMQLISEAIDIINQQMPPARRLTTSAQTVIAGAGGSLDSLGLLNFIIMLEEKAGAVLGHDVRLLDESSVIDEQGPFRTVDTLASFLEALP